MTSSDAAMTLPQAARLKERYLLASNARALRFQVARLLALGCGHDQTLLFGDWPRRATAEVSVQFRESLRADASH